MCNSNRKEKKKALYSIRTQNAYQYIVKYPTVQNHNYDYCS